MSINPFSPSKQYVKVTFRALTDALLPSTIDRGNKFEADMGVHEYLIYALDHYVSIQQQLHHINVPLALPTAVMLDHAAAQLVYSRQTQPSSNIPFQAEGMFTRLSRLGRIKTLAALEKLEIDLFLLPSPFQNNAGLVKFITDALNRFAMFGYYSEWPAYGTTRLYPPDKRRLEFFPLGWQQVGYPGVSLGYRDFRGFLLKMKEVDDDQ